MITKPSRGLHEQCWHHLWSPQKSVHYNLPKICPRKFTQKEEFLWKKMSTRIHTKCPREFTLRKCSLEFAHFEKSVHENSLSKRSLHPGYHVSCVGIDLAKHLWFVWKKAVHGVRNLCSMQMGWCMSGFKKMCENCQSLWFFDHKNILNHTLYVHFMEKSVCQSSWLWIFQLADKT